MSDSSSAQPATDPYRLNRDVAASTRLGLQHYIWKESMGYNIHPSIDLSSPNLAIADVGTGTGIWLHDVHRQLPNAELHGFDISDEQYPAAGFLPPNMSLRHLNILQDIPPEYVGKYDLVHARLLVQVVNQAGGDPRPIIQNVMKMLKPGGFLQWEEPNDDASNRPIIKAEPSISSENWEKLLAGLNARFQSPASWSAGLADTLKEQGLQSVVREEYSTDSYLVVLDQINYLGLFSELLGKVKGEAKDELSQLHGKAVLEARKGVAWKVRRFVFVARKVV